MKEFALKLSLTFSESAPPFFFFLSLFLGLVLTLLAGLTCFESHALPRCSWFSASLASTGFFFYGQTLCPDRLSTLSGTTPLIIALLCLAAEISSKHPLKQHRLLLYSLLPILLFFVNAASLAPSIRNGVNGLGAFALFVLSLNISKHSPLSLLKTALLVPFLLAPLFLTMLGFQIGFLTGTPVSPYLLLTLAAFETSLLFWAYGVRLRIYNHFTRRLQKRKPFFAQGNTTTHFNPFSEEQDFLRSAAAKLTEFKEFRVLSAGIISEAEKTITLYQWSGSGEKELAGKLSIPPQILEPLLSLQAPFHRFLIEFNAFPAELSNFLRQCTAWERSDFIVPIHREKKTAVVLFLSCLFPPHATNRVAPLLLDVHESLELLFFISETLQKERELQPLLLETRERKTSYESLNSKIHEIHHSLSELQSKQSDLIQSERWISISQITVTLNHEINNPLTHVLGTAQLLKMKIAKGQTPTDAQFQHTLKSISEQCLRIVEIIKSLRRLTVPVIEQYLPEIDMIKLDLPPQDAASPGDRA